MSLVPRLSALPTFVLNILNTPVFFFSKCSKDRTNGGRGCGLFEQYAYGTMENSKWILYGPYPYVTNGQKAFSDSFSNLQYTPVYTTGFNGETPKYQTAINNTHNILHALRNRKCASNLRRCALLRRALLRRSLRRRLANTVKYPKIAFQRTSTCLDTRLENYFGLLVC